MHRLAQYDVSRRYPTGWRRCVAQIGFGSLCGATFVALRTIVDFEMPGVAPFALIFPPVLVATLFGHWRAGLVALLICIAWSWIAVFPPAWSLELRTLQDAQRLGLNAVSGLIVILFAEAFRSAVREKAAELERQITYSEMLRRELDHRTKNNLQLMQSLISVQRSEETSEAARAALAVVKRRLSSFTKVYSRFPVTDPDMRMVPMRPYIEGLISDLRPALFGDRVSITASIAELELTREAALAVGLYTNEALTNCAKYAFPDGRPGNIDVRLELQDSGWTLKISDDGAGLQGGRAKGEGSDLMEVLAQQAGGLHEKEYPDCGCNVRLTHAAVIQGR